MAFCLFTYTHALYWPFLEVGARVNSSLLFDTYDMQPLANCIAQNEIFSAIYIYMCMYQYVLTSCMKWYFHAHVISVYL
jgi:hypothetical protein